MPEPQSGAARKLPAELARLLHDLRGPLNSAVMHLEVLKRTVAEDPGSSESLRTVLQQLARLSEMLPAAFAIAALEPGTSSRVPLRSIVERAREDPAFAAVRVVDGTWPDVSVDAALLELAIVHLLRNATEATPADGTPPEVTAAIEPDAVALSVRDWGRGLPPGGAKVLGRLLYSTKPGHRGMGVAIVERVARLHGGSLTFELLADGTRVTLRLGVPGGR
jgi:signal transduction histidine kinase